MFLETLYVPESFFNKIAEALTQVFSREFCRIFKNNFFTEHLWATASATTPAEYWKALNKAGITGKGSFPNFASIFKQR